MMMSEMTDQPAQTAQEPREPRDRRHPAEVTADRLRSALTAYRYDLTPREVEAATMILLGLYRVAGIEPKEIEESPPEG